MKLFLDTNVLLRFFVRDVEAQYQQVKQLFEEIEAGQHHPYTSALVLLEMFYTLSRSYKLPRREVATILETTQQMRGLTVIDKTNTEQALALFHAKNIPLADCYIASQIPTGVTLVTYDKDFAQLEVLNKKPGELV